MMIETLRRTFSALLLLSVAGPLAAVAPTVPVEELLPQAEHRRATRLITHVIANYHYRKVIIDDDLSRTILTRYLETLDPTRSYLLQEDIDAFERHADRIDDYLRSSSLEPMFEMFIGYRKRLRERIAFAVGVLDEPLDFSVDESIEIDREEAPWPRTSAELDDLWRKRVKNDFLSLRLAGKEDDEIRKTLRDRYKGLARRTAQLTSDDVFQTFVNAFTTSIDPHTSYFSPRTSENFKIRMSLSLEGIGAVLQSENEMTLVREVVTGGPADLSGKLRANDRIVGIGQDSDGTVVDVVGWRLDDVVDLIRGPKGSVVRLEVLPKGIALDGPTQIVAITRNTIKLEEQAAKGAVQEVDGGLEVGVITVPTFYMDFEARSAGEADYRSTTRDVRRIIDELVAEGAQGLIVDLRGNGGGSLNEATELTGLFIDSGPVVQVRDSQNRIQIERDTDKGLAYTGPLVVLVDRNSASASEIFAGAIQDYERGLIIGEPTFGKGTVQNLVDLNRFDQSMDGKLGQLKATIAQFFRVNGDSTQHRGIVPDVVLPTVVSIVDHGERSLDHALPWTSIEPARYTKVNYAGNAALPAVRAEHERRMLEDPAFQALLESENAIKEARQKTEISLVESIRREEHEEARKDQLARENAIRVARGLEPLTADEMASPDDDEDLAEDAADDAERDDDLDVVLDEAGRILRDWMTMQQAPDKRLVDTVPSAAARDLENKSRAPAASSQVH